MKCVVQINWRVCGNLARLSKNMGCPTSSWRDSSAGVTDIELIRCSATVDDDNADNDTSIRMHNIVRLWVAGIISDERSRPDHNNFRRLAIRSARNQAVVIGRRDLVSFAC